MKMLVSVLLLLATARTLTAGDALAYPAWDRKETVAAYAARVKLEPTLTLDLGNGVKWEGVLIPAGQFVMGSPNGEAKTEEEAAFEKQHKVVLSKPFYIGKFETTQAQYQKVSGS